MDKLYLSQEAFSYLETNYRKLQQISSTNNEYQMSRRNHGNHGKIYCHTEITEINAELQKHGRK
jgi:hypothetical protein